MKFRLKPLEVTAATLAVLFVWVPLAVQGWLGRNRPSDAHITVYLTALTLIVLIFQAVIFLQQKTVADRQRRLLKRQLKVSVQQTDLNKEVFLASHRPRLRVRHVWISDNVGSLIGYPGFTLSDNSPIIGSLIVVNEGGSDALIRASEYRVIFLQTKELPPGAYGDEEVLDAYGEKAKPLISLEGGLHTLAPGESLGLRISGTARMTPPIAGVKMLREFSERGWHIFVMGQIQYDDTSGRGRFVGFCRRSDLTEGFRPVKDPDYEYQD